MLQRLGISDPRLRALFGHAHIGTRCLAEIEQERGTRLTHGQMLSKHLRWAKRLSEQTIPAACAADSGPLVRTIPTPQA